MIASKANFEQVIIFMENVSVLNKISEFIKCVFFKAKLLYNVVNNIFFNSKNNLMSGSGIDVNFRLRMCIAQITVC